ncbi:hypothetical protein PIB30_041118 [Stylosanthes scabra]|uniref:F-box associated domain-containing protein n=1 Tax=Stylosanthes scabra TaxID=79078 RepID=A0ABU6QE81_9FABA|nr:hypothetical protein [Stylosanthes scabra]
MLWNPCTDFTSEWLQTRGFIITYGFGYDDVNDKYKFFAAVKMPKSHEIVSKIFTFGKFAKGTFNWLVPLLNEEDVIVYFDLGRETYGELRLSERDPDDNFRIIPVIDVLRICLSICFDHKKTHWALWLLNEKQCYDDRLYLIYLNDGRIVLPMIDSSSDDDVTHMSKGIGARTLAVYYPSLVGDGVMF